jgi:hypothetical protein
VLLPAPDELRLEGMYHQTNRIRSSRRRRGQELPQINIRIVANI